MKFIWFPISWIIFVVLIDFPLQILGWILIPIAAACGAYESYAGYDGAGQPREQNRFTWKFMWLWDNKIDGISNNSYSGYENMFMRIVSWSANRNSVSNLRFVPYLSFKIIPMKVRFIGSHSSLTEHKFPYNSSLFHDLTLMYDRKDQKVWFLCWHGAYSCFYYRGKNREFLLGWKVYPKDIYGVNPTSYRFEATGFGTQWKKI